MFIRICKILFRVTSQTQSVSPAQEDDEAAADSYDCSMTADHVKAVLRLNNESIEALMLRCTSDDDDSSSKEVCFYAPPSFFARVNSCVSIF
jgi:hypothetical protein